MYSGSMDELTRELFRSLARMTAPEAARRLLGCELVRDIDGATVRVEIVETEAYDQTDPASHAYGGMRPRAATMFGPAGHLYVYFTYGMHHCCNVVCGPEGYGAGALIRAVRPIADVEVLSERRGGMSGVQLTNGPAKLCQALGVDRALNGHDLRTGAMRLQARAALADSDVAVSPRIGISRAVDVPWRFYVARDPYVSKSPRSGTV